jgi:predicted O-methyltransferase YrrM
MAKRKDLLNVPMTVEWNAKPNRKYFLQHLIETNNFTTMVEVGVRDGRTTFYLLDKIPTLTIYAIDLNISLFYNNEIKEKYGERLIPIQGNSSVVSDKIPLVDLIFIDADHSYEGCRKDIKSYKTKVKSNGILSGHDIDYPGVNQAVRESILKYDVGPNNVWIKKNL